jgi:hypothetical protein
MMSYLPPELILDTVETIIKDGYELLDIHQNVHQLMIYYLTYHTPRKHIVSNLKYHCVNKPIHYIKLYCRIYGVKTHEIRQAILNSIIYGYHKPSYELLRWVYKKYYVPEHNINKNHIYNFNQDKYNAVICWID